jgi:hypothetical protein
LGLCARVPAGGPRRQFHLVRCKSLRVSPLALLASVAGSLAAHLVQTQGLLRV